MVTKKSKPKTKETKISCCSWNVNNKSCGGCAYILGFIGAAVYYVSTATGIWGGIVGVLKAIVWPAFLVHGLLKFIGA